MKNVLGDYCFCLYGVPDEEDEGMKKGQAHKHIQNTEKLGSSGLCLLCWRTLSARLCIGQREGESSSLCRTSLYGSSFRL